MCIWQVSEEERHCEYCSYRKGCEKYPVRTLPDGMAGWYISVMCEIVGGDILDRSRKWDLVWGRNIVAYRLVKNGFSLSKVGEYLGMDHSTILHCKRQVERMLKAPCMYRMETEIWEMFNKKIGYEDQGQTD